jgi:hypothetical protein
VAEHDIHAVTIQRRQELDRLAALAQPCGGQQPLPDVHAALGPGPFLLACDVADPRMQDAVLSCAAGVFGDLD